MASAVQYGQLMGNSAALHTAPAAGQSQLCYQYEAAPTQPALATSPVQSDPLQLLQQRSAIRVVVVVVVVVLAAAAVLVVRPHIRSNERSHVLSLFFYFFFCHIFHFSSNKWTAD